MRSRTRGFDMMGWYLIGGVVLSVSAPILIIEVLGHEVATLAFEILITLMLYLKWSNEKKE